MVRRQIVAVVDDSLTVRKILEVSLDRAGFTVDAFPDEMQVLRALSQNQVLLPDAIILDVCLPKMDGYTIARAIALLDTLPPDGVI